MSHRLGRATPVRSAPDWRRAPVAYTQRPSRDVVRGTHARVAQLAEQLSCKQQVVSSILTSGSELQDPRRRPTPGPSVPVRLPALGWPTAVGTAFGEETTLIEIRVLGPLEVRGPDAVPDRDRRASRNDAWSALSHSTPASSSAASRSRTGSASPPERFARPSVASDGCSVPTSLITTPPGYTFTAHVDAVEFDRLAALAPTREDDTRSRCSSSKRRSLWRGPPSVEFASEPWADAPRSPGCTTRTPAVVEDLTVLRLDAGETAIALPAIQALIDEHPVSRPPSGADAPCPRRGRPPDRRPSVVPGLPPAAPRRDRHRAVRRR